MIIYLQDSLGTPQDWRAVSITRDGDWRSLAKKAEPVDGGDGLMLHDFGDERGQKWVLDPNHATANDQGWVYDLEIQGVQMSGADHIHLTVDGGSLVVTRWNDDPVDWAGDEYAQQWTFRLPVLDGRVGKLQPRQSLTVWAASAERRARYLGQSIGAGEYQESISVIDWSQFSAPGPANMVMHGVWMTDALDAAHAAARTGRGWNRYLTDGG